MRCLLILGMLSVLCKITAQEEVARSWSEAYKLQWSDFQGEIQAIQNEAASTTSGLTFGYKVKYSGNTIENFEAMVEAQFYPLKSWFIKEKVTAVILNHEQLHFDITELHARKFRKALKELRVQSDLKYQIQRLYTQINQDLNQMQKRYDQETNHSINTNLQRQWEQHILEELKKLDRFKSV